MAIDPSIALAVQPVNVTAQYPTPFQNVGQILSLQQMMRQGQMQQLELQQAQQMWEERQRLNQLLFGQQAGQQPTQAPAPSSTQPATSAPAAAAPDAFAAAPLATQELLNQATAAQPAAQTAPTLSAARPTGEIQTPGQVAVPDFQKWIEVAPNLGPQMMENYSKAIKSYYDLQNAQFTQVQNTGKRVAQLAGSIVDPQTQMTAIATAVKEGLVNPEEGRRLMTVSPNDPIWKSWQNQGMTASENASNEIANARLHMDQLSKAIEFAKAPYELQRTQAEATTAGMTAADAQRAQDAQTLAVAAAQGPAQLQTALAGLPAARQAAFAGATTPTDILTRGLKPQEQLTTAETKRQHNITAVNEAIKTGIEKQKFDLEFGPGTVDSLVEQIRQNPDTAVQNVPQALRTPVAQGLTAKYGLPFPKPLSGQQSEQEVASRSTLNAVNYIRSALDDPEIAGNIGPILGRLQDVGQRIGTAGTLSPAAAAKAQELRTQMRLLLTQEPREFGGRLTPALMEELQKSGPRVDMNIDMLKGALNGTEVTSLNQLDNLDKARFGGKARPRTDRGLEPTQDVRTAIMGQKKGPGMYQMTDGSAWYLTRDGQIIPR